MRKIWKYLGIAALVVALGLGTVATVAFAQGATGTTGGPFNYYERFRQTLAGILGISVEQYDSAVAQAHEETLRNLVNEGWLTQDQADQMRQRLEKAPEGMFGGGFGRGFGRGRGMGIGAANLPAIAAEKLGMAEGDLLEALRNGQTIAGLAQEKGVDVQTIIDAYIAELTTRLNQEVADGRMTQKMADWLIEQARTRVEEEIQNTWPCRGPSSFPGLRGPGGFAPGDSSGGQW